MRTTEFIIPLPHEEARERIAAQATFLRRSTIEDRYFENGAGAIARLRRQDSISRLSCARWGGPAPERFETIVLDAAASQGLLDLLGFKERERLSIVRDSWRKHHYALHLDRVAGLGQFLTVELPPHQDRRKASLAALKVLKQMGISIRAGLKKHLLDRHAPVPYTASIA